MIKDVLKMQTELKDLQKLQQQLEDERKKELCACFDDIF